MQNILDIEFDLDRLGNLMLVIMNTSLAILILSVIILIIKIIKKDSHKKLEIIGIIVTIILISILIIPFKNKYVTKVELSGDFNQVEICWDNCTTVNLTEEEVRILKDDLNQYYFGYDDDYFISGWMDLDIGSKFITRTVIIKINETELYYHYIDTSIFKETIHELGIVKNKKHYVKRGRNRVTDIFDPYIVEHQAVLNSKEE